jgi:uncharacterized membrane protein
MNIYLYILLRTTHIFASMLWIVSAFFYFFFVEPSVKSLGPVAPKFMQEFIEKRRYSIYMSLVSALTILSGVWLYWNSSGGLQFSWIKSGPGIGFTIGAVVSLLVFLMGMLMIKPRAERIGKLGREIGESGNPSNLDKVAEMQKLGKDLSRLERIDIIMLTIAMLTMVTGRFWGLIV